MQNNFFETFNFNHKFYELFFDLEIKGNVYLNHAPSFEKHALCQAIRNQQNSLFYYMFDFIIAPKKDKLKTLTQLNKNHERLKLLWLRFYKLSYFSFSKGKKHFTDTQALKRSFVIYDILSQIGKLIGYEIKNNSNS